jgi:chromosome segregation ATPase
MDPLSIAASACGIAALCGTIISRIGTFCADIKALPQNLEEFTTNISTLRSALEGVDHVVSKGPKHLVFAQKQERKHWQDVKNVLEACNNCLYKLRKEIPELPADKHRLLQQARIQLEVTLKSNVVMQIRGHISSYTQVLQLSLTTMTL